VFAENHRFLIRRKDRRRRSFCHCQQGADHWANADIPSAEATHAAIASNPVSVISCIYPDLRLADNLHFLFSDEDAPSGRLGRRRKPMMKIQLEERDDQLVLLVEGRVAGAFVPELERCWQAARSDQPHRKISVDLKSVTCVDRAGRCLFQSMHGDGVDFLRAGLAVQDILEQIMGQPECKH